LFPLALLSGTWGFLLSLSHDWFTCQLQRAEFLRKGSHKGPLFRMFPLSLQSIISNQMRPWRLRGAWFSRLLRHPARRQSGSILSPGPTRGPIPVLVCKPVSCTGPSASTPVSVSFAHCTLSACACVCTHSLSSAITVAILTAVAHGQQGPTRKAKCQFSGLCPWLPPQIFAPNAQIFGSPWIFGDYSTSHSQVISEHKNRHANMSGKYVSGNPTSDSWPAQTEPAVSRTCAVNKLLSCPKSNHVGRTRFVV